MVVLTEYVAQACRRLEEQMNDGEPLQDRHWAKLYLKANKRYFKNVYTSFPDLSSWRDVYSVAVTFAGKLLVALVSTFVWVLAPVLIPFSTYLEIREKRSAYRQYLEDKDKKVTEGENQQ